MMRSEILIIAGNDSSGLAGIQRDCATTNALGVHARTCISATTSQDPSGIQAIGEVNHEEFSNQLMASNTDIRAIKIGLLVNSKQVETVSKFIQHRKESTFTIFDPVFSSSTNGKFQANDTSFLTTLKSQLLPYCDLLTPNIQEAEIISGVNITSTHDLLRAANSILQLGVKSVVIKGGHADFYGKADFYDKGVVDFFKDANTQFWLSSDKQAVENTRGTGCTFASAVASAIALNYSLWDAVVIAKMTINQSLRHAYGIHSQLGPVSPIGFPNSQIDLPFLYHEVSTEAHPKKPFPATNLPSGEARDLGIYPIVDSAEWVDRLAASGISTIQLRNKTLKGNALRNEISTAIKAARKHNLRLFINDYWELAIELGAYGVHLGQGDLETADIESLRTSELRLGLSTHCHYEVARAHTFKPSYIACGPVYPTTSKEMPWVPHDLSGLQYWKNCLDYPLVAIGGISLKRVAIVANTGVSGIAMISAITDSKTPVESAATMINYLNKASPHTTYEKASST